jgi:4-hydroxybutyrate dehydrogenase
MQLFKLKTTVSRFDTFAEFACTFDLGANDLVLTHDFLYKSFIERLDLKCLFVMLEKYGQGEPSDEMINRIIADVANSKYDRVVAIGGGTVIDVSKLLAINLVTDVADAFERKVPIVKEKRLITVPTTCGTGSEMTNITIAELKSKSTKMGLADDALLPDDAVLIPELLMGLPFKFFAFSAIDALIHATESYVSPKSNPYTQMYCREAISIIVDVFSNIAGKGPEYYKERLEDMLIASNYAGIAFGNTGVGAVHALSYPLGGVYHVPHGEANYQFFTKVFKLYSEKKPCGIIREVNSLYAKLLNTSEDMVYIKLDELLGHMISKNSLRFYGMQEREIDSFTSSVLLGQQRLLNNNYAPFSEDDIRGIYTELF